MPIDVAILGCGHPHLPDVLGVVASERDLRLAAVWDSDPSAIPGAIAGQAVRAAETAIRRGTIVVVCAPTDQRPALCVQAAQAGRPVLVEKPIARTASEARALAREVARSRTPAMAALFLRELPALRRLRDVLRERLVGRLAGSPRASRTQARSTAGSRARRRGCATRRAPASAGSATWRCTCWTRSPRCPPTSRRGSPRSRSTATGAAPATWAGSRWARGRARRCPCGRAGRSGRGGLELVVAGSAGTATLRDGTLELARGGGEPQRWIGAEPDAGEALRGFAARLRARRLPRDGLDPAVEAQALLEAAVRVG